MARFTVRMASPLPPGETWRRVWNLDAHSRVIPLTHLRGDGTDGGALTAGSRFVARTSLGPLGVDDVMEVRDFAEPTPHEPGQALVEKTGRVVHGRIRARVEAAPAGSVLTWEQEIGLLGVPRLADPVVAAIARAAYTHVLGRLLTLDPTPRTPPPADETGGTPPPP